MHYICRITNIKSYISWEIAVLREMHIQNLKDKAENECQENVSKQNTSYDNKDFAMKC